MTKPLDTGNSTDGQAGDPYAGIPGYEHAPLADAEEVEDPREVRRRAREAMKAAKAQLRAAREPLPFNPLIMGLTIAGIVLDLLLAGGLMMGQNRGLLYDNIDASVQDSNENEALSQNKAASGPAKAFADWVYQENKNLPADRRPYVITHATPKPLGDFKFTDGKGRAHLVGEFKGKVVLLNLWATWCGPCKTEMPTLAALQKAYAGKALKVVAVNTEDEEKFAEAQRFIGINQPLTFYSTDLGVAMSSFGIRNLPATSIIDKKGREVALVVGNIQWDAPETKIFMDNLTQ